MPLFDLPHPVGDDDSEMASVQQYWLTVDPAGKRFGRVLRDTIDQLLDGEHTGRFDWNGLHKTEKTHAGTLIEINLLREFELNSGLDMDYLIRGIEVDCKFSQTPYGWMIPPEALDEICLVVWADDWQKKWSAGLLRANRTKLTTSGNVTKKGNRDGKFRLTKQDWNLVHWLWHEQPLEENLLLHLDKDTQAAILAAGAGSKRSPGQAKVNELFRRVQKRRVNRTVVRTLAQQKDYMKRVRYNGGAREKLRNEGILICGDYPNHQVVAKTLGLPIPQEGESVSIRVVEAKPHHACRPRVLLEGRYWVEASPEDARERAPLLPETKKARSSED
ncbi:NaeI family type II restriction endonuclease [Streptomyces sp. SR27]|uniref:NaeI family type II restriction endonuclease n=1 Tax=Streptomyces sp. SR27 TaxID=3076630 RepID=UPI00295C0955|nr:NaeI family type II restriction endonuclease [Streptomyces sp. SR27]MDV9188414.1 NaeI family type II restriction endonuclease [Streptomyces sp. SR27]